MPIFFNLHTRDVKVLQGNNAATVLQKLDSLSDIIKDDTLLVKKWKEFVSERSDEYFKAITGFGLVGRLLHKSGLKLLEISTVRKSSKPPQIRPVSIPSGYCN